MPPADEADDPHILVEVNVAGLDDDKVVQAQTEWMDELFRQSTRQVCAFRLTMV